MRRDRGTTPLRRLAQSAAAARPVAWLSARLLHRIDGVAYRASRGRRTFSTAVPGWARHSTLAP